MIKISFYGLSQSVYLLKSFHCSVGFCSHTATGFPYCSVVYVPFYFDWPEILVSVVLTPKVVWPFCSVQTRGNRTDTHVAY